MQIKINKNKMFGLFFAKRSVNYFENKEEKQTNCNLKKYVIKYI